MSNTTNTASKLQQLQKLKPRTFSTSPTLPAGVDATKEEGEKKEERKEELYSFFPYDSQQQYPAPDGKRLITCCYRSNKDKEPPRPNEGVFIPNWINESMIKENLISLIPSFISYLQAQEEEMIKEAHREGFNGLQAPGFNVEHLVEYIESKNVSARLSAPMIAEWFVSSKLQEALTTLYMEKTEGDDVKTEFIVTFISKKFQSLASPKTTWTQEEKDKLLPFLETVADTAIGAKLIARVNGMKEPETLLDIL